jgi:hypothetical protein
MKTKLCECGCGREVTNEKNRFINGHNTLDSKHSEKTKLKISQSEKGKKTSEITKLKLSLSALKRTPEQKLLCGKAMSGKHHSTETKLKISINHNGSGFKGKKHSEETKSKLRSMTNEYIKTHKLHEGFHPNIGKNETYILNKIQDKISCEIIRNSKNIANKIQRFPDGYIQEYNLVTEIDEPNHYTIYGTLKRNDQERELVIASHLRCMIYRIKEQEFLTNPEKEIQRFKDFLTLLDQGVN